MNIPKCQEEDYINFLIATQKAYSCTEAARVQPDKLNPLAIKGIQFTGQIVHSKNELCLHAAATYHKRYPFALSITGDIWMLQPLTIKMTDNTLNFGKKLHWQSNEVISNF